MCDCVHRTLPCRLESVTAGRHFLAETFSSWGMSRSDTAWAVHDEALLVVTELLSNAVLACVAPVELTIEGHATRVHLSVPDDTPGRAIRRSASASALGGRGLAIVAALSAQWGQSDYEGGFKAVWAELRLPPGAASRLRCTEPR